MSEFQENQEKDGIDEEMQAIEAMRKRKSGQTGSNQKSQPENRASAVKPQEPDIAEPAGSDEAEAPKALPETYHKVRFHVKSRPDDDDNVVLSVQGDVLLLQRDVPVIIPNRYLDCARNARYPQFRQLPNQPRKIVGQVLVYPFDLLGEATEAEYREMLRSGNEVTRKSLPDNIA